MNTKPWVVINYKVKTFSTRIFPNTTNSVFIEKNKTCKDCEEETLYFYIDKMAARYTQKRWNRNMGIKFLPPQRLGALSAFFSTFFPTPAMTARGSWASVTLRLREALETVVSVPSRIASMQWQCQTPPTCDSCPVTNAEGKAQSRAPQLVCSANYWLE